MTPLHQALAWKEDGRAVALATVAGTWGSSPRRPGSLLAVAGDGAFEGSVSGGCIEGAVVHEALDVLQGAPPRLVDYGVSDADAWAVGLACGGEMRVWVEAAPDAAVLRRLIEERPLVVLTDVDSGSWTLVPGAEAGNDLGEALRHDRSGLDDGTLVRVFNPPLRMILVGAVHIAQALAPMARLAGFEVTVVDPRRAFASSERFPDTALVHDWPDEALEKLAPDGRTAVITLSHDAKIDDPALVAALKSDAFYIGSLGSRRTQAKRLERLTEAGFGPEALNRIHGPVGLDLGGRKPEEIAVSALAQALRTHYGEARHG